MVLRWKSKTSGVRLNLN